VRNLIMALTILAAAVTAAFAQNASPAASAVYPLASSTEVAAAVAKLKREKKEGQALAIVVLKSLAPFSAVVQYNTLEAPPNIHEKDSEIFYVLEGSGTVVLGGKLVNEKRINEANLTGTAVEGGTTIAISKGDFFIAPPRTAHWFNTIKEPLVMVAIHAPPH
jgi:mannose-6-phosphate isomerase-like protein (cupin superfamily)